MSPGETLREGEEVGGLMVSLNVDPPTLALPGPATPVAEAAEIYAVQLAFAPVPLYGLRPDGSCMCPSGDRCPPRSRGKHPIGDAWQKRATVDLDDIRDRFRSHQGNVGLYLGGSGRVLIDADSAEGVATVEAWGLPRTLRARSGSGKGGHWILELAPHQDPSTITDRKVAPGVDVKVRGQFVAAPSRHFSGGVYTWTDAVPIATLPDEVYGRIRRPVISAPAPLARAASSSSPDALERRARAYVAKIPPAVSGSGGHDQAFAAARALAGWLQRGLPESIALGILNEYNATCQPPWNERELQHKWLSATKQAHTLPAIVDRPKPPRLRALQGGAVTGSAGGDVTAEPPAGGGPDWRSELLWTSSRNGADKLVIHVENVIRILQLHPEWQDRIGYDEFAGRVLVADPPWDQYQKPTMAIANWTDEDGTRLCGWLRRTFHRYGFSPSITDCDRAVDVVARTHAFHPVREYLSDLEWDGTSRLGTWCARYLGAEQTPYLDMVSRWWLISAVARVFRPGVMVRTVPILEGPQELRKSSAIKVLAGEQWTNDTPIDIGSKDAYESIKGCWFVELAELDSLMRAGSSAAKAFFSSGVDRYRPPYGRRMVENPRQCIFVGTVNPPYEYFDDPSGHTRYHPIRCTLIDLDGLAEVRDQLWAEAVAAFHDGQLWYPMTAGERLLLGEEQDDRGREDSWAQIIRAYVKKQGLQHATVADILSGALGLDAKDHTRPAITRVGIIMVQTLKWQKVRRRSPDGSRFYEYASPDGSNAWADLGSKVGPT